MLADDHARSYFVETIPMSLVGESNLEDLLNTRETFRAWMENGGTKYNVVLMVPWAVDKSAAGSQTDWDVIWAGFSPTVQDYSRQWVFAKGEEIDSITTECDLLIQDQWPWQNYFSRYRPSGNRRCAVQDLLSQ